MLTPQSNGTSYGDYESNSNVTMSLGDYEDSENQSDLYNQVFHGSNKDTEVVCIVDY